MANENGNTNSERLDRAERLLESIATRLDKLTARQQATEEQHALDHERVMDEIRAHLKWQVVTQNQLDQITRQAREERQVSRQRDERVDKLVSAIGQFVSNAS